MTEEVTTPSEKGTSQAYLLFGICFVLVVSLGSAMQGISLRPGLAATLIFLILVPALIFIRKKGVNLAEGLRLRRVRPSIAFASILLGLGTWGLGMTVARGLESLGLKTFSQGLDGGMDSPMGFAMSLVVVAVGAGVCEECLFRGAIQGVLERRGKWFGVLVTAALFGVFHMALGIAIPAALMGCFYGWVVIRTGSIIPAMIAHFTNNAAALSFLYFLEGKDPSWLLPCLLLIGVVAIGGIIRFSANAPSAPKPSPLTEVPATLSFGLRLGCVLPLFLIVVFTLTLISTLPYFITMEKTSEGENITYANPDSPLFKILTNQPRASIVYTVEGKVVVGRLVELSDEAVRVSDADGTEVEVPIGDLKGVVIKP